MPAAATDTEVARALVQSLSALQLASVRLGREPGDEARSPAAVRAKPEADVSFLGQLAVSSGGSKAAGEASGAAPLGVDELEDARTLLCVLRAGSLRQRRAAARRLTALLRERKSTVPATDVGRAVEDLREPALEHELRALRAEIPRGARRAWEDDQALEPLIDRVSKSIALYWDGESTSEPLATMPRDRRALLLHDLRELPDSIVHHIAAIVEGEADDGSVEARRELLTVCRHAGDPRLVPALVSTLVMGPSELRIEAARALAEVDDPRVPRALSAAYERALDELERAELGAALGAAGDPRARRFVRSLLTREDRELRLAALRALEHLGDADDLDLLLTSLAPGAGRRPGDVDFDEEEVWQAVRTLGRIGDGRALAALGQLYGRTRSAGLRADIEEGEAAIRARIELRGEAVGDGVALPGPADEPNSSLDAPFHHWLRGLFDYVLGHLLLVLGAVHSGVERLERAAQRRPRWSTPWVTIAMAWARRGRHAEALGAFRRALSVGRGRLERNPIVVRALARAFLRRAEEIEREGRVDIARGLLAEALAFDLRRAPSALRFELKRQHELLAGAANRIKRPGQLIERRPPR